MNKEELKSILKPLIKECIKEVMFEKGVLSRVVTEVAQGMGQQQAQRLTSTPDTDDRDAVLEQKRKMVQEDIQRRKKLLDQVGLNGVDIFEGTEALPSGGKTGAPSPQSPLSGVDPRDSGVDISSLIASANGSWSVLKGS